MGENQATKSDLDYYMQAAKSVRAEEQANELTYQSRLLAEETQRKATLAVENERLALEQSRIEEVKAITAKRAEVVQSYQDRKNAATTSSRSGTKTVIDYLEDSDEAFDEWYKKLENN